MNAMHVMLYEELRQSEQEILQALKHTEKNNVKLILEEELADIRSALKRCETGKYGLCEISGEIIPEEILKSVPTIKSKNDLVHLEAYYRKPIHYY